MEAEFAGEEAACERHTCQNTHLPSLGFGKERIRRALAKAIKDDLYRLHIRVLDGANSFLDLFDAHAVVAYLSYFHQVVEYPEDFRVFVERSGWAMQLQQVERVCREVAQTVFDPHC